MQNTYDLSTADLQRAAVTSDQVAHIVTRYTSQPAEVGGAAGGVPNHGSDLEVAALLAMLLKNQMPANCRYNVYPYNFSTTDALVDGNFVSQILPQNTQRKFLSVQALNLGDNNTETFLLFEESSVTPQVLSSGGAQALAARALSLTSDFVSLDSDPINMPVIQFSPAPTNAISIVGIGVTERTYRGIIIEGY